ncbi:hypothetical protein [Streptomyces sp. WAC 06738]|uniref:hypothetical protein n=1 Tax=Streptomyces sp. WAC 06738 TaxID=2203210 RepID=UPI0019D25F51|nr:hypothetical protein [Streptomyces sp. WAC 06738]
MHTATLSMSGLRVSRIVFGTWQLGGDGGSFDEGTAVQAIRHAREQGVTFTGALTPDTAFEADDWLPRTSTSPMWTWHGSNKRTADPIPVTGANPEGVAWQGPRCRGLRRGSARLDASTGRDT